MTQLFTRSGTPASPLCFGTMQFGGTADRAASQALYASCRAAGINFFDTAHVYTNGLSETFLGEYAAAELDDVLIATKLGYDTPQHKEAILSGFDTSLSRLKMERVDLLYLHRYDPSTPLEETFEALATLKVQGKIRYIGISNFAAWQVIKAAYCARETGVRIDVLQPMYSLVKRQAEVEIFPACLDQGIGVVPYSPLGGGLLTGKYAAGEAGRLTQDDRYARRYDVEWMHAAAATLPSIAARYNTHPATLAVAWARHHEAVNAPIISARSVEQLAPSLDALTFDMTPDLYAELTALTPTPAPATDRLEEA